MDPPFFLTRSPTFIVRLPATGATVGFLAPISSALLVHNPTLPPVPIDGVQRKPVAGLRGLVLVLSHREFP